MADEPTQQNEGEGGEVEPEAAEAAPVSEGDAAAVAAPESDASEASVEAMAEEALETADAAVDALRQEFVDSGAAGKAVGIDLLNDVNLELSIELGRTQMYVEDVLRLTRESVIELDKAAGDPVDIYVNGRHVARGEVLVLNDNFCVRVSEIVQEAEDD